VQIRWPSGEEQELHDLASGFRYDVSEGEPAPQRTPFLKRTEWPPTPVTGENQPHFEDTWLYNPVPLPERRTGPGLIRFTAAEFTANPGLAAQYALFRRYLFDWRTELEVPLMLLLDQEGRAVKIYARTPSASTIEGDLAKLASGRARELALPFAGRYFTIPARNYYRLGAAFYLAGFPDESALYFEEVLKQNPSNDKALNALGQIALAANRLDTAKAYLERAVAANPRAFEAWGNLGGVEFARDEPRAALPFYERALALKPKSALALTNCGQAYLKLGNTARASSYFEAAVKADPLDPEPLTQLGLIAAQSGRESEARRYFQSAIKLKRDHTGAINNLGVLYMKMGQPNDAIAAFEYGIRVAPSEDIFYLNLGRVFVSQGNRESAANVMRRWLEQKPGNPSALKALRDLDVKP
jgi:tetratricopeptide (TPR) repeat protein